MSKKLQQYVIQERDAGADIVVAQHGPHGQHDAYALFNAELADNQGRYDANGRYRLVLKEAGKS